MKILVIDNYDSFVYNLVQYTQEFVDDEVIIRRNDEITLDEVAVFDKIILSPGPGIPSEAGILIDLIKRYAPDKSILGVCLGEQAIAEAFGATLENLTQVYHGVAKPVQILKPTDFIFKDIPKRIPAGRYHSWVVSNKNFPKELEIIARDDTGMIMALKHKHYDVRGIQFHPESILTPMGKNIIKNWINH